jgi:hypothetical protein
MVTHISHLSYYEAELVFIRIYIIHIILCQITFIMYILLIKQPILNKRIIPNI